MKRIEFIAPVEAMRGNLSGKQELVYPANDNKAYDAPLGERAYARNYQPRFVGAKRAKDGLKYFAVRTKSAVKMTAESRHAMAIIGGIGAIYGAIQRDETYNAAIIRAFQIATRAGEEWKSIRAFVDSKLRVMLETKANHVDFGTPSGIFKNPWVDGGTGASLDIPETVLVKFWTELANSPITFKVGTQTGIAHSGETFGNVISSNHNVLKLSAVESGTETGYVKQGAMYVVYMLEDEGQVTKAQATSEEAFGDGEEYLLSETPGEIVG